MVISYVNKIQAPKVKYSSVKGCIRWNIWHKQLLSLCYRTWKVFRINAAGVSERVMLFVAWKCMSDQQWGPKVHWSQNFCEVFEPWPTISRIWNGETAALADDDNGAVNEKLPVYHCICAAWQTGQKKRTHIYRKKRIKPSTKPPRWSDRLAGWGVYVW